jgi:hypothetical protein
MDFFLENVNVIVWPCFDGGTKWEDRPTNNGKYGYG